MTDYAKIVPKRIALGGTIGGERVQREGGETGGRLIFDSR